MRKQRNNVTKFLSSTLLASAMMTSGSMAADLKDVDKFVGKGEKAVEDVLDNKVDVDFYGSLRFGADYIDANIEQDGLNGRDFLSRVGTKAKYKISDDLSFIGQIEFGTRSDVVDIFQEGNPGLRLFNAGLQHKDYGTVTFGSSTTIFHSFVRSSYFSDGLDTIRLSTIREDDFLQWRYKKGPLKFGVGTQLEGQDGSQFDQFQVGAEYSIGPVKLQGAYVRDNEGENEGNQFGFRAWWDINDHFTVSGFHHQQDEDFDFPSGVGSTGTLRLRGLSGGLADINFVTTCVGERRTASGLYGRARFNKHQIHGRVAVDNCEDDGTVYSLEAEYVYHVDKNLRTWLNVEHLQVDDGRIPSIPAAAGGGLLPTDDFLSIQAGLRFDF